MSHQHQPLYLSESIKADEISPSAVQEPLQQGTRYEYHLTRRREKITTRISQGHKSIHESKVQEQVDIQKTNSSSNCTKSKLTIQESKYELEINLQHESSAEKKEIKHSGHPHTLCQYKLREENHMICTVCELDLLGSAYGCEDCDFFLHKSCFDLPQEIKHRSHANHSLSLLSHSPYQSGRFLCNACRDWGDAFHYYCAPCKYDLHVSCAGLPKTVYRKDFKYPLNIFYSNPHKDEDAFADCNICHTIISKKGWVYTNRETDYNTHLECALEGKRKKEELEDMIFAIQEKLQTLKVK